MAGFGVSIKNSFLFALIGSIGAYLYSYLSTLSKIYYDDGIQFNDESTLRQSILFQTLALIALFFLVGIPFFKFLSDTVEEGVVEF